MPCRKLPKFYKKNSKKNLISWKTAKICSKAFFIFEIILYFCTQIFISKDDDYTKTTTQHPSAEEDPLYPEIQSNIQHALYTINIAIYVNTDYDDKIDILLAPEK